MCVKPCTAANVSVTLVAAKGLNNTLYNNTINITFATKLHLSAGLSVLSKSLGSWKLPFGCQNKYCLVEESSFNNVYSETLKIHNSH